MRTLQQQIEATEHQLAVTESNIGSSGKGAIIPSVGDFEQQTLQRTIDEQVVASDITNLETTELNAISQTLYVMQHVSPSTPERSVYPDRLWQILLIGLISLGIWLAGSIVVHSIRSHLE